MEKLWLNNIHYMIEGFSDIDQQKKVWLGFGENVVSSYSEDLCILFDDFEFNEFIEEWKLENLDKNILKELIFFRDELNLYNKKKLSNNWTDKIILEDPQWMKIVNQAKAIMTSWNNKEGNLKL